MAALVSARERDRVVPVPLRGGAPIQARADGQGRRGGRVAAAFRTGLAPSSTGAGRRTGAGGGVGAREHASLGGREHELPTERAAEVALDPPVPRDEREP